MNDSLRSLLGITIALYLLGIFALTLVARRRIASAEDFIVAGRRLPLSLAWATLLATWFGAGTLLTVADEVRREGLQRAALDPLGAGLCLVLAGLFFARPLWRMGLLTVSDFFRRRFGRRAELLSALVLVPSYFGWIAAQFVALAALLELVFDLPLPWGLLLVALVGTAYTWLGGMWSVTLTDAAQIAIVLGGLVVLAWNVTATLGDGSATAGWSRLLAETPPELLRPWPAGGGEVLGWISVLLVGALGNIPGQDLLQRVFAARSERVAARACQLAGAAYLAFGSLPILLALASRILLPEAAGRSILPTLASLFLTPAMAVVFTLALVSAVLSTIDSALLSPASVLAQNVLRTTIPPVRRPRKRPSRIAGSSPRTARRSSGSRMPAAPSR
jgi:Na+/proline symporter